MSSTASSLAKRPFFGQCDPTALGASGSVPLYEPKSAAGLLLLWGLLLTTLIDLNQIAASAFGITNAVSLVMLLLCLGLYIVFQFKFRRALGPAGRWYVACFIIYCVLGTVIRLEASDYAIYVTFTNLRQFLPSLLITSAVALGARHAMLVFGPARFMSYIFFILSLHVAGILLGTVAGEKMYSQRTTISTGTNETFSHVEGSETGGRQLGFFANPNQTGMTMGILASVAFGCMLANRKHRWLFALGLVAAAAGCLSTFSRSALIAFILVTIVQVSLSRVFRQWLLLVPATLAIAAIVWFVTVGAGKIAKLNADQEQRIESFQQILRGDVTERNTGSRFAVAANGIRYWLEKPMFGHGIGSARFLPTKSVTLTVGPHNQFIAMLVDCGILGLILYSSFFASSVFHALACPIRSIRVFGTGYLMLYLCNALTGHTMLSNNTQAAMLGIFFGCLAAAKAIQRAGMSIATANRF